MPTYDYKCADCDEIKQYQHKMNETFTVVCEKCQKTMKKGFSCGTGLHFKESGFYETDYKNK